MQTQIHIESPSWANGTSREFYLTTSVADDWDTSDSEDELTEPITYDNLAVYVKDSGTTDLSPWVEELPKDFYLTASPADDPEYCLQYANVVYFVASAKDLEDRWDTLEDKHPSKFLPVRECSICCRDDIPILEFPRFSPTDRCRHEPIACLDCLSQHIDAQIADKGVTINICCPDEGCSQEMVYEEVKLWATPEGFERYDTLILRLLLSGDVNFVWCKNPKCGHGQIHMQGDQQPIVICSHCRSKSCFKHQIPWHEGDTCAEYDSKRADPANQQLSRQLINKITKPCPKCQWPIQKNEGCEHMTCRCAYEFCWICLASHKDIMREGNHRHKPNCRLYAPPPRRT